MIDITDEGKNDNEEFIFVAICNKTKEKLLGGVSKYFIIQKVLLMTNNKGNNYEIVRIWNVLDFKKLFKQFLKLLDQQTELCSKRCQMTKCIKKELENNDDPILFPFKSKTESLCFIVNELVKNCSDENINRFVFSKNKWWYYSNKMIWREEPEWFMNPNNDQFISNDFFNKLNTGFEYVYLCGNKYNNNSKTPQHKIGTVSKHYYLKRELLSLNYYDHPEKTDKYEYYYLKIWKVQNGMNIINLIRQIMIFQRLIRASSEPTRRLNISAKPSAIAFLIDELVKNPSQENAEKFVISNYEIFIYCYGKWTNSIYIDNKVLRKIPEKYWINYDNKGPG